MGKNKMAFPSFSFPQQKIYFLRHAPLTLSELPLKSVSPTVGLSQAIVTINSKVVVGVTGLKTMYSHSTLRSALHPWSNQHQDPYLLDSE